MNILFFLIKREEEIKINEPEKKILIEDISNNKQVKTKSLFIIFFEFIAD